MQVDGQTFELAPEEIVTSYEGPENLKCILEQGTFLALDTTLTPELLQEGLARDFNRLVQDQRKAHEPEHFRPHRGQLFRLAAHRGSHCGARIDYLRHELLAERLEPSATPERWGKALAERRGDICYDHAGVIRKAISRSLTAGSSSIWREESAASGSREVETQPGFPLC